MNRGVLVGVAVGIAAMLAIAATNGAGSPSVSQYGRLQAPADGGICVPGLTNQTAVLLTNTELNTVYVGSDVSVNYLNGTPIAPSEKLSVPMTSNGGTVPGVCVYSTFGTDAGGVAYWSVGP